MTSWIWSLPTDLAGDVSFSTLLRNKRGQFRGHLLTPEGKINDIIITGNNKITLTQSALLPPHVSSGLSDNNVSMNESIMLSGRVVKKPEGRSRQSERRTAATFRNTPQKFGWCHSFLKHSFLRLLHNYPLTIVAGLGGLVNTTGVRPNICSGYSQKTALPSSLSRLPPKLNGFWTW